MGSPNTGSRRFRRTHFRDLGDYDYRPAREVADEDEDTEVRSLIDVDILGHIFEQSITDLERLRQDLESSGIPADDAQAKTKRKKEGAFYTPAFITRYIVEQALGGVIKERFQALREQHETQASGTARKALADPDAYVKTRDAKTTRGQPGERKEIHRTENGSGPRDLQNERAHHRLQTYLL